MNKVIAAVVYCALSTALTGYAFDPVLVERAKAGALKECEECDFANAELKGVDFKGVDFKGVNHRGHP